jgi:hypothetical protein
MKADRRFDCSIASSATPALLSGTIHTASVRLISLAFAILTMYPPASVQAVEITPFAGQRYGGSFEDATGATNFTVADGASFGVMIDFDLEPDKQIEFYLSRQNTHMSTAGTFTGSPLFDLTVDDYHIGGLYFLQEVGRVRPFISGTFGLTRMEPKRADLTTENHLSLSLGGGAKIPLTDSVGLRFDVRSIYTMLESDTSIFCSGGCTIGINSSGFVQVEVAAALMMRF